MIEDLKKLDTDLPDDIDALQDYWASLSPEDKQTYLFLLEGGDYAGLFQMLRINRDLKNAPGPTATTEKKRKPKQAPVQATLNIPYPRDMTRCSPFFPVPYVRSKDQAKVLPYLNDWPLASNAWGTLTYKGPTLTTAHEDIMVALLSLVQEPAKRSEVVEGGSEAYAYRGSLRELLVATGCKQPNGQEYEDAFDQLADLAGAVVSVLNTKGRRTAFSSLISGGKRDDERFEVIINPEFLRAYREGDISFQSLQLRSSIRSLIGRALYRFVAGQSEVWKGSIQKLAGALNVQLDKVARRKIRGALAELIELKVLGKGSGVTGDIVVLVQGKALR